MPNRHGKETDMKISIEGYEVIMDSGRVYSAADLLTPKSSNGQRKSYDTIAVYYHGTVDINEDITECDFEMVDWVFGADSMKADDIWSFLMETAIEDDKRREEEENRK